MTPKSKMLFVGLCRKELTIHLHLGLNLNAGRTSPRTTIQIGSKASLLVRTTALAKLWLLWKWRLWLRKCKFCLRNPSSQLVHSVLVSKFQFEPAYPGQTHQSSQAISLSMFYAAHQYILSYWLQITQQDPLMDYHCLFVLSQELFKAVKLEFLICIWATNAFYLLLSHISENVWAHGLLDHLRGNTQGCSKGSSVLDALINIITPVRISYFGLQLAK